MILSARQRRLNIVRHATKILISSVLILSFAPLLGCAGMETRARRLHVSDVPNEIAQPGTQFDSVEEAAIAALVHVRLTATRSESERLHVGSIVRREGGYTWLRAERSGGHRNATWRPKARISISRDHVAVYVVHPRTGDRRTDRANERITPSERRLVDDVDPLHRPIFLLTPAGRIVTYSQGAPVVEIAALRGGRVVARDGLSSRRATASTPVDSPVEFLAGAR